MQEGHTRCTGRLIPRSKSQRFVYMSTCRQQIDCKELIAGSTLFLPIAVEDAVFSVGDGHAAQGDGEASVTAIECPMDLVQLRFELLPDVRITTPRARTAEGWLTLGVHADLHEATMIALDAMLDLLVAHYAVDRATALALASVAVDLRITQIVNQVKGVHAVLPHGAIETGNRE
jgi:acetamidase/formamidase